MLLTRLSTLLRSALRSMGGEDEDFDLVSQLTGLSTTNHASSSSSPRPSQSYLVSHSPTTTTRTLQRAPAKPSPFPGFVPGTNGGYSGTDGQGDWAMEREMEILRLEEENKSLREILVIADESAEAVVDVDVEEAGEVEPTRPTDRRKSSMTMEELEADAEKEQEQREGEQWVQDGADAAINAFRELVNRADERRENVVLGLNTGR
jgi:hypothetical protein